MRAELPPFRDGPLELREVPADECERLCAEVPGLPLEVRKQRCYQLEWEHAPEDAALFDDADDRREEHELEMGGVVSVCGGREGEHEHPQRERMCTAPAECGGPRPEDGVRRE